MTSKEYLSDGWGVGRRMVFCLESEHQKWLKNSEGSSYTNVLFLLPLFPRWFYFFFLRWEGLQFYGLQQSILFYALNMTVMGKLS